MDKEFINQEVPVVQQDQPLNVYDIVNTVFKRKYTILAVFLFSIVLAITGYYIYPFVVPNQYEAKSTLLIKFGREFLKESLYQPELSDSGQLSSPFNRSNFIGSEIQILMNRDIKEKVLTTLGIENVYPGLIKSQPGNISSLEYALLIFDKSLSIEEIRGSDVIQVFFKHHDPQIASEIVNLLVGFYQEKRLEILTDPRRIEFLKQVLDEYSTKVEEAEQNLSSFKKKYGISSLEEQKDSLLKQNDEIDTALIETQNRIKELKQILSFQEEQIQIIPKFLSIPTELQENKNSLIAELESKLIELKFKENELLQKFKESNTWVVSVRKEIDLIKELIKKEKKKAQSSDREYQEGTILEVSPTYQQMESDIVKNNTELKGLEVKEINLLKQKDQLSKKLKKLYTYDRQYKGLTNDLSEAEKDYQILYKKYEEASISEEMDRQNMTSITVIQKATPPVKPIKQRKGILIFVAGGISIGLVGGAVLAILLEYISKVISTPAKAEKVLGLPILVTVPLKKI